MTDPTIRGWHHPEKLLAAYLHRLRQLREKMVSGCDNGTNNLNNANCAVIGTGTATATPTP